MTRNVILTIVLLFTAMLVQPAATAVGTGTGEPGILNLNGAPRPDVSHRLIVELASPPLAEWSADHRPAPSAVQSDATAASGAKLDMTAPAATQHIERLQAEQRTFVDALRQSIPDARLSTFIDEAGAARELTYQIVFNGLVVDAGLEADVSLVANRLRGLPGVTRVYRDYAHDPDLYASLPLIGASAAWDSPTIGGQANAGAGIKVASVDAGVHHAAAMFDGTGYAYPPGYPLGYTENTNGKIIASRAYFRDWDPPQPGDDVPWPGPYGISHGVHTASTAAGNAVTANYRGVDVALSGVAPRAYLMSYRTFYGSVNGIGSMYSAEGIAAIEDAVRDGADVMNNSWGGGPDSSGGEGDPLEYALANAWKAGVFVSMSNGNAGPAPATGDHPQKEYVNVGSTTTSGTFVSNFLNVTAPEPVPTYLQDIVFAGASFGGALPEGGAIGGAYLPAMAASPDNFEGCQPWPADTYAGLVAVISRGSCEFGVKALNAEQAGAVLVVVYNHADGGDGLVSMAGGVVGDQVTIPAVFVGNTPGVGIVDWHRQHTNDAQLEVSTMAVQIGNTPDRVASSSSRGPGVGNILKPDLAAPGVNILAQGYGLGAGEASHLGYGQASGTSMASPHVAGAAALVRQLHPDWSNDWVKSALMSGAQYLEIYNSDGTPAQPLDIGAGRLDLRHVADPGVILDPPKISFGKVISGTTASMTVSATSVADAEEQYQLSTVFTADGFDDLKPVPGLGVSMRSITLAPGETKSFEVTWNPAFVADYGDHQGYVLLTGENHQAHMPAWMRVAYPRSDTEVLIIDNDGSSIMTDTLRAIGIDTPFADYAGVYTQTLRNLRYSFDVWDADAHGGASATTIPHPAYLGQYDVVLYETGDYWVPDGSTPGYTAPTMRDTYRLVEYVNDGGRVITFGQDLASSLGLPDSSPFFYGFTLGATFLQDSVSHSEVLTDTAQVITGLPGTPFSKLNLDISAMGDGAGNQAFVDEVVPDVGEMAPFKYAMPGTVLQNDYVATSHRDEPTLERSSTTFAGRALHLAFGLEGVNNDTGYTSREDLMFAALAWVLDEAAVEITHTLAAVNAVTYFEAPVASTYSQAVASYRWAFGDGTPILETDATGAGQYGHIYRQPGTYTVRVEATNDFGTKAIGQTDVEVVSGSIDYIDRWGLIYLPSLRHGLVVEPPATP